MQVRAHLPGYRRLHFLANAAVLTGVYTGVALALTFTLWLIVANDFPVFEKFARERNLAGAVALAVVALVPILRFWRLPGNLLMSGLLAWAIMSLAYRLLCIHFIGLAARNSATHVFTLGAVVYLIAATVCWIGTCIWKLRESDASRSHSHIT
jgi:hypothetical protein